MDILIMLQLQANNKLEMKSIWQTALQMNKSLRDLLNSSGSA